MFSAPTRRMESSTTGNELIASDDRTIMAVASNCGAKATGRPTFHIDDTTAIADFISNELGLRDA